MKILIVGSGGREHALAWKAAQSAEVEFVYVAPGNAGTALEPKTKNVAISPTNIESLITFCQKEVIDLTIIGPEAPLALGIVDEFTKAGLACFGPSQQAAQLEASKDYAKAFMTKHHIPTAVYQSFTEINAAKDYIRDKAYPLVIKADGLAAGKGVIIAATESEAKQCIDNMLAGNQFGEAGHRIVIEEFLTGEEASFIALCDGENCIPLVSSQDHKARDNADQGPNTGGMGAYSPAPIVNEALEQQVLKQVIEPVLQGMKAAGTPFVGFLYAGLMIDKNGQAKVLEFNCRLGDPEAQVLLFRLNSDIVDMCQKALAGKVNELHLQWDSNPALGVVMAAKGYPFQYEKNIKINGLEKELANCKIFHAGTKLHENCVVTSGGRVLCVCAKAETIKSAQLLAYEQVQMINCEGLFYRTDIGFKALNFS